MNISQLPMTKTVRLCTVAAHPTLVQKLAFLLRGNGPDNDCSPIASITDGEGDLIDFCNPQIAAVTPGVATDNDFLTLSFDPDIVQTALNGVGSIYLCAKGYTNDGQVLEVCTQTEDAKLKSYTGHKSAITIWPRAYFSMQEGQTLEKIEYFFTDATGTVKVGFSNTAAPFVYTFKCQ